MTPFESSLAAALEAEVKEIAMTVDNKQATASFEARLDEADRSRRRSTWVWGAAAAAGIAAALVAVFVLATGGVDLSTKVTPAEPTPSGAAPAAPYSSVTFAVPFAATLPAWSQGVVADNASSGRLQSWDQSQCDACAAGSETKLRVSVPASVRQPGAGDGVRTPDYKGYLAHLATLEKQGSLSITDRTTITVGGRPATVFNAIALETVPGGLGCDGAQGDDCFDWDPTLAVRMVVVDVGGEAPLLMWTRSYPDNPALTTYEEAFDAMLASMTFR